MTEMLKVRNPRTGESDYEIPVAGEREIAAIAERQRAAQPSWLALGIDGRIEVLKRFRDALEAEQDAIVTALSTDTGRRTLAAGELKGLMNGGIHDAVNLADKLIRVIGGADDGLLDLYSRQRHFVATRAVIPQAAANRQRMAAGDRREQEAHLNEHRSIAADPARCREFLLRTSMITSLREAERVD